MPNFGIRINKKLKAFVHRSPKSCLVRNLNGSQTSALAATAQLPTDSDFDEPDSPEKVEMTRLEFVHPDQLALMGSGREDTTLPIHQHGGRSPENVSSNANNSVVHRNGCKRRRSRKPSVESVVRGDSCKPCAHGHGDHINTNQDLQQWAPAPFHESFQPSTEFYEKILAMARMHNATYTYHSVTVNNHYNHESR
ncbi:hypothetical protein KCU81_g2168, partial [Aureobasidium melanogenum]